MNNPENLRPPNLEARVNKMQLIIMMAAACGGFAVLYFFFNLKPFYYYVMGLIVVIAVVYAVKELLQNDARVVINQQGVLDKRLGVGTILWRDIKRVYVVSLNNIDHVCLELYNEDKYLKNRSSINNLGAKFHKATTEISPFNINTGILDVETEDIFEGIMRGCEYYAPTRAQAESI